MTTIHEVMKNYYQSRASRLQIQNDIVIGMYIDLLEHVLAGDGGTGTALFEFAEGQRDAFQKLLEKEII